MARDHALALSLPPGQGVLRLYRWVVPTLSLGRNEPAVGRYDRDAARQRGIDVVRRPTGGRAVLHDRELTYSVVVPVGALGRVRDSYLLVNRALRRGLASMGVPAEIAGGPDTPPPARPDAGPCFRQPAEGELTAGGRKLVGSAQARIRRALLQHGSILVEDDQGVVDELMGGSPAAARPATLAFLLDGPVPGWEMLANALVRGFRDELGGTWAGGEPEIEPEEEERLEDMYRSRAWTWRR